MPGIMQGQSLAPLLLGADGWEPESSPAPLLLYDLWNDPHALSSLHEGPTS